MKLENVIKDFQIQGYGNQSLKPLILDKIRESYSDYDFVLRFRKDKHKIKKLIDTISDKKYYYKHVPYVGLRVEKKIAKDIIEFFLDGRDNTLSKEFSKEFKSLTNLDVVCDTQISDDKLFYEKKIVNFSKESLWNLSMLGVYYIRDKTQGKGIKIGIIDSGVEYTHDELKSCFGSNKGYDFVRDTNDPNDYNGHGTHVAGIVAGENTGIALKSQLYAIRVLDENGSGSEFDVMRGVEWALDNKLDIINLSLGSHYGSDAFRELCDVAKNHLLIVAAAGNDGTYCPNYPASFGESVISTAAIDEHKKRADFSTIHDTVDISAPGVDIVSSYLNNQYASLSGTSMATPHITGCLSLFYSIKKEHDLAEDVMKSTAEKIYKKEDYPDEYYFGYGLARVDKMVERVSNSKKWWKK